jgi:hypothetical protein
MAKVTYQRRHEIASGCPVSTIGRRSPLGLFLHQSSLAYDAPGIRSATPTMRGPDIGSPRNRPQYRTLQILSAAMRRTGADRSPAAEVARERDPPHSVDRPNPTRLHRDRDLAVHILPGATSVIVRALTRMNPCTANSVAPRGDTSEDRTAATACGAAQSRRHV